jgi:molybdopterin converting factor small subunit
MCKSGEYMIVVELFGTPRLRAGTGRLEVEASTAREALAELARRIPALAEVVEGVQGPRPHYRVNLNGSRFLDDLETPLASGDCLLLMSADVGG